ncbi:hypothetical protein [Paludisphaera sp.]|uniref:hypothetical protein n=1 Tax=Paludisphaera sp. TaxID=2017432 RepID=UPI00301E50BF
MPFDLDLPRRLKARGWKVKIFEKERLESPHVTIYLKRGDRAWRVGLRDGVFIVPPGGGWNDIDRDVRELVEMNWDRLRMEWDRLYPINPISSREDDDAQDGGR